MWIIRLTTCTRWIVGLILTGPLHAVCAMEPAWSCESCVIIAGNRSMRRRTQRIPDSTLRALRRSSEQPLA